MSKWAFNCNLSFWRLHCMSRFGLAPMKRSFTEMKKNSLFTGNPFCLLFMSCMYILRAGG